VSTLGAVAGTLPARPTHERRGSLALAVSATLLAAVAALLWLLLAPRTPDLAAQSYRVSLFLRDGFALWDNNWYAGHHVPGYSLIYTPLAALIGMRVVGALAAIGSALIFERLASAHFGSAARLGAIWLAVGTASDLAIGRMTYALGAAVGLACLLALQRRRLLLAGVLAALCAATSPISGLFVALAGATLALTRHRRDGVAVGLPSLATVALLSILFPEGGRQPFGFPAFAVAVMLTVAFVLFVGREQRELRIGALLYLAAIGVSFGLTSPMGGNVVRLGAVFGGPLLLCAVAARTGGVRAAFAGAGGAALRGLARRRIELGVLTLTLAGMLAWQWNAPVREIAKSVDDPLSHGSYYAAVLSFLEHHQNPIGRVEVPFTLSHWEAAFIAPHVPLARGWEKQLDARYDKLFFHQPLPAARYHGWLRALGVRYVALPDAQFDPSSRGEVRDLRRGLPFLHEVWSDAHWRVFALTDPVRLAQGPARLTALGEEGFSLRARRAGRVLVRVHYTPYWAVSAGTACVGPGPEGFTEVIATHGGPVRVGISFSLARIFSHGLRCPRGVRA
jgi:hypothetical protein